MKNEKAPLLLLLFPLLVHPPEQRKVAEVAEVAAPPSSNSEFAAPPAYDAGALRDRYEERAAIIEFDGQEDRARAQARAWHEVAAIWYRQHGKRTPGHLCAGCGLPIKDSNVFTLPLGERVHAGDSDRAYKCLHAYGHRWKATAAKALVEIGIPAPAPEEESL